MKGRVPFTLQHGPPDHKSTEVRDVPPFSPIRIVDTNSSFLKVVKYKGMDFNFKVMKLILSVVEYSNPY
jgi:hypothetical protein